MSVMRCGTLILTVAIAVIAAGLLVSQDRQQAGAIPHTGALSQSELEEELSVWDSVRSAAALLEHGCGEEEKGLCRALEGTGNDEVERVHNYATGETWWFGHLHNESYSSFEMYEGMEAKGFVNVEHVHPEQAEQVVVLQGVVRCTWQERNSFVWHTGLLRRGDWITVPAGVSHALENAAMELLAGEKDNDGTKVEAEFDEEVVMRVRYTPGTNEMKDFFRSLGRLSESSALTWMPGMPGIPDPIHTAMLWSKFPELSRFWWMPTAFQSTWAVIGSFIGGMLGAEL